MNFEAKIGTTFLDYEGSYIYNSYHRYSHERTVNNLIPDSNGGTIADLGCSRGTYYELIKNKNYSTIYGIDISTDRLEKAKLKGYITINTPAQILPFENNSIDCVISIDMLVHVLKRNHRSDIFKEVSRVLKKKGYFILSIPSKKAYIYSDYGVSRENINSNPDGIINDYCSLIDFAEIKTFSEKNGFIIKKIISTQFDLKPIKFIKKITKEYLHYGFTLPLLDLILGKSFLKEFGKAAFFKLQKV